MKERPYMNRTIGTRGLVSLLLACGLALPVPSPAVEASGRLGIHIEAIVGDPILESCQLKIWPLRGTETVTGLIGGVRNLSTMILTVTGDADDCSARDASLFNPDPRLDDMTSPLGVSSSYACTENAGLGPSAICAVWGDFDGIGSAVIQRRDDRTLTVDINFPHVVCPRCRR